MSEDMSPYCSEHNEWLIMKLCTYVGYHTANNVKIVGGDPVTQLNFKKTFYKFNLSFCICAVLDIMRKRLEEHILVVTQLNLVLSIPSNGHTSLKLY